MKKERRYGFVKPQLIALFTVIDSVGGALLPSRMWRPKTLKGDRILLINLAHIGDVVMTTPAIRVIRKANPKAHLAMIVGPWAIDVVRNDPHLDEVIAYRAPWLERSKGGNKQFPLSYYLHILHACTRGSFWGELHQGSFDLCINFKSFFQESLAAFFAGIPRRVGYGIYGGGFLLTDVVDYDWDAHNVVRNMALVEGAGIEVPQPGGDAFRPQLYLSERDREAAQDFLSAYGGGSEEGLVALHIGAGYPSKRWPLESYARLANEMTRCHPTHIILVGGKDDLPLVAEMTGLLEKPPIVAAGKLRIMETAALLAKCALFVGNDSGPAHLATAMGIPSIVLFSGENDAKSWCPYGDNCIIIQKKPDCWPCGKKECYRNHLCMTSISVEEVLEASVSLA